MEQILQQMFASWFILRGGRKLYAFWDGRGGGGGGTRRKRLAINWHTLDPKAGIKCLTSESDTRQGVGVCQVVGSLKNTTQHGWKAPRTSAESAKPTMPKDPTEIRQKQLIHEWSFGCLHGTRGSGTHPTKTKTSRRFPPAQKSLFWELSKIDSTEPQWQRLDPTFSNSMCLWSLI